MTMQELQWLCVDKFAASTTRAAIMRSLVNVYQELCAASVVGELMVDGSFLTEKIDPKDVDFVFALDAAKSPQIPTAFAVRDKIVKQQFTHCDSYFYPVYPIGHPAHAGCLDSRHYWIHQFGFSRSKQTKAIAIISVPSP